MPSRLAALSSGDVKCLHAGAVAVAGAGDQVGALQLAQVTDQLQAGRFAQQPEELAVVLQQLGDGGEASAAMTQGHAHVLIGVF